MEEILQALGTEEPFDEESGELTNDGYVAYERLIYIIGKLHSIGVINETVDSCEKQFNEIIGLGF